MLEVVSAERKWSEVNRSQPCPVCQGTKWCQISTSGQWATCRRQADGPFGPGKLKLDKDGVEYYAHRLTEKSASVPSLSLVPPLDSQSIQKADANTLNRVYLALLEHCALSAQHRQSLLERGLTNEDIQLRQYRSHAISSRNQLVRKLEAQFTAETLLEVPGFYSAGGRLRLAGSEGLLIPCRDLVGRIVAIMIRSDSAEEGRYRWLSLPSSKRLEGAVGARSELNAHAPLFSSSRAVVRLTEGHLKADVATALSGIFTLSFPGVSHWKVVLPLLKALRPEKVLLAIDRDWEMNPTVCQAMVSAFGALRELGYQVALEVWPLASGKGIDDVLAGGGSTELLEGDMALELVRGLQLDEASKMEPGDSGVSQSLDKRTHAEILLELAQEVELFHTPSGDAYGSFEIDKHRETWPIRSKGFRNWLLHRFYQQEEKPPHSHALSDALRVLEAEAAYDCPTRTVGVRVARAEGKIYLDLANENWEAVEISAAGWQVVSKTPVWFRRTKGMLPLPYPSRGGKLDELRHFINLPQDDPSWKLLCAWLVATLNPSGPYPILVVQGEQGSAKSTACRIVRSLIDPSTLSLRSVPKEERDLAIAASNAWVIGFDNLSGFPQWLSDALCRLSTGGGFATRELYSDFDEVIMDFTRPLVVNGIEGVVTRPDLADRALILQLESISGEQRRPERRFWAEFEEAHPRLLGALCDIVSEALRNLSSVRIPVMPRMADFAEWVVAAAPALPWKSGEFLEAYSGNRQEIVELTLESDSVATMVRLLVAKAGAWQGSARDLLTELDNLAGEKIQKSQDWPKGAHVLSGRLKRAATFLRQVGVHIEYLRSGKNGTRSIFLGSKSP